MLAVNHIQAGVSSLFHCNTVIFKIHAHEPFLWIFKITKIFHNVLIQLLLLCWAMFIAILSYRLDTPARVLVVYAHG